MLQKPSKYEAGRQKCCKNQANTRLVFRNAAKNLMNEAGPHPRLALGGPYHWRAWESGDPGLIYTCVVIYLPTTATMNTMIPVCKMVMVM